MSVGKPRENEFKNPGGERPETASADVPGAVPGQAGVREDIVGGAVGPDSGDDADDTHEPASTDTVQADAGDTATATEAPKPTHPGENTQDEPAMDMHDASIDDKIAGIEAQTRQDVGGEGVDRVADVLAQRFSDAGIRVSDEQRRAIAERITGA